MSTGLAGVYQSHLLGVYSRDERKTEQNNRLVFSQLDGPNFLYYWDWGPNSGANWMVSDKYWETDRGIESYNLERFPHHNLCAEDLHLVGPMKVWNSADRAWQTDWTLRLESFNEETDCCDKVRAEDRLSVKSYCDVLDWDQVYQGYAQHFPATYQHLLLLHRQLLHL